MSQKFRQVSFLSKYPNLELHKYISTRYEFKRRIDKIESAGNSLNGVDYSLSNGRTSSIWKLLSIDLLEHSRSRFMISNRLQILINMFMALVVVQESSNHGR